MAVHAHPHLTCHHHCINGASAFADVNSSVCLLESQMPFLFVYVLNKYFSIKRCGNDVGRGFGGGRKCSGEQAAVFAPSWEVKTKSSLQAPHFSFTLLQGVLV